MQELFDSLVAEMKAEIQSFKSEKSREGKIRGLATIASLVGSMRAVVIVSDSLDESIVNGEKTVGFADNVVLMCIKEVA